MRRSGRGVRRRPTRSADARTPDAPRAARGPRRPSPTPCPGPPAMTEPLFTFAPYHAGLALVGVSLLLSYWSLRLVFSEPPAASAPPDGGGARLRAGGAGRVRAARPHPVARGVGEGVGGGGDRRPVRDRAQDRRPAVLAALAPDGGLAGRDHAAHHRGRGADGVGVRGDDARGRHAAGRGAGADRSGACGRRAGRRADGGARASRALRAHHRGGAERRPRLPVRLPRPSSGERAGRDGGLDLDLARLGT